ncbi:MAG: type I methionyl aminopeptidase [Candidatus Binatia bacterium]|jgi:methionyl aminopeptidase|nr:type I methionyl aminopeptidase [Candidatus Binatia bacterium]MDG2011257.1 type I methionyl aminopeptidase [Candidatus Binatia bacterium]HAC79463.1 type I methionyl aminopeptidase [Deltaproteobacteria bacterium]
MIVLRRQEEVEVIRSACRTVGEILQRLREEVRPGISTGELDRLAEAWTKKAGAEPAFKGYTVGGKTYPSTLCVSINEEVVHGMPSDQRILQDGDIVGLDFGVIRGGYYGDGAITIPVGKVTSEADDLIRITSESLDRGIEKLCIGNRIRDISAAIQKHAEAGGYGVVKDFVGHGIGQRLHEDPQVPNYVSRGQNPRIKEGMVLAIEPMVCLGTWEVDVLEDGWTAVTRDRNIAAHFEHSVAVTANGPEVLTIAA